MSVITMRRGGNIIELSLNGGPLPPDIEQSFKNQLRYTHLYTLRGIDAYDHLGNYRPTRAEIKELYHIDRKGRFNASIGWQYRLRRELERSGYSVEVVDVDPPHPRPNRYEVIWDRIFERMDLRVKQDEILAAMEQYDHGLIDVPAGVGKTFLIGAYALAHPYARIHVITEGLDILNRIYRHLVKFIPNVGMVGGGKRRFGSHVTVISADSLHVVGEGFDDPSSPRAADVVFFDEVHKAGAPTILEQIRRYRRCKMYGLSASIGDRFDGADFQLEGIFGEVIFSMTYQEAEALGLVSPIRVEWVNMDFECPELLKNKKGAQMEKWLIWRNEERNRRFAQKMQEFDDDTQCLILVATVTHAVALKQFLPEYKLCYDQCKEYDLFVRRGLLDPRDEPPMTPARREQMRVQFEEGVLKKVIATDVWSTGVDFSALSVLGRLDGRDSRIMDTQAPCRANRIHEGKAYATVVDCMDYFHPTLQRRSNNRRRHYIKQGWTQVGLSTRRVGVKQAKQNGV